jgi:predicted transcriptional regulator
MKNLNNVRDFLESEFSKIENFKFDKPYKVIDIEYLQYTTVHKIVDGLFIGNSIWEDQTIDVITLFPKDIDLDSLIFLYNEINK